MDQRSHRLAQDAPARPLASAPRNGPLVWWAACSFAAILGFSRLSYGLLLPAVQRDLGGTYAVYGTLATLNFVGYLLGTLCLPLVLARTQRRLALTTGASLAMNGALLASASSVTLWQLGIWRVLIGVCSAPALVLTMALTLECMAPTARGKASGLIWMGGAMGSLLSGLLAPALLTTGLSMGWRLVWVAMGIGGSLATLGFHVNRRAAMPAHGVLCARPDPWTAARWLSHRATRVGGRHRKQWGLPRRCHRVCDNVWRCATPPPGHCPSCAPASRGGNQIVELLIAAASVSASGPARSSHRCA
jgi:MFS family permease